MPGEYYVSAVARIDGGFGGGQFGRAAADRAAPARSADAAAGLRRQRAALTAVRGDDQEQVNYAPTYFPGVAVGQRGASRSRSASARKCSTSISACSWCERRAISGHRQQPGRHAGRASGNVNLMPEGAAGGRGNQVGIELRRRASSGTAAFTISNVPPGRYTLRARSNDSEVPQFAVAAARASTAAISPNVTVMLSAGATDDAARLSSYPRRRRAAPRPDADPGHRAVHRSIGPRPAIRTRASTRTARSRWTACRPGRT